MATFINQAKNSSTFTNQSRTPSGIRFEDLPMSILEDKVFQNGILADGTALESVNFDDEVPGHLLNEYVATLWNNAVKN